jgi:thiopurine S-methyltransferase
MDPDFWHSRWANNQIGFHEGRPNEYLTKFIGRLGVRHGTRIFVPMCGKGVDMLWLADQGYRVLGVELSPVAVQAFFAENELAAQQTPAGPVTRWKYGPIEILCGDFFALTAADLSDVGAVYDRAALIALPEDLRNAYARHLEASLPKSLKHLLVTLDYPQEQMSGPPFSVDAAEVRRLFPEPCVIEPLASRDALEGSPHLKEKGVTRLRENAFLLTRC